MGRGRKKNGKRPCRMQTCSPGVDRGTKRRREAPSCFAAHAIANPGQVVIVAFFEFFKVKFFKVKFVKVKFVKVKFFKVKFSTSIASAAPHKALGVAPLHGRADPSDLEAGNYDN